MRLTKKYCREHIPGIVAVKPQAGFHDEVVSLFRDKAGFAMNEGSMFGEAGKCHMRFDMGNPRSVIEQAMHQFEAAVKDLK